MLKGFLFCKVELDAIYCLTYFRWKMKKIYCEIHYFLLIEGHGRPCPLTEGSVGSYFYVNKFKTLIVMPLA